LGGVLFELADSRLYLVATDGRRLGAAYTATESSAELPKSVLPNRALHLLERCLPDGPVQVGWDSNRAWAKWEGVDWTCRVVEGRFPTWRDVMPTYEFPAKISIPAGVLLSSWRQALIATNQESTGIDVELRNGTMVLSATTADVGESNIELPISYDGAPLKVTLGGQFVAEFLAVLDASQVVDIQARDSDSPVLFCLDDGHRYLVMPLAGS